MSVPLGKLVFFSSVATSGTCTLLYFLIQKMFSRASYYQLALEHLHSHAEALEALGTPLSVHYLQLTDKYNFEDIADAQLRIPVSGPKSEGHLYVSSSREGPFRRWNLQEVFLELRDGHRIPVFKPSGEGPASLPVVLAASVRRVSKRKRFPKVSIRLPRRKAFLLLLYLEFMMSSLWTFSSTRNFIFSIVVLVSYLFLSPAACLIEDFAK